MFELYLSHTSDGDHSTDPRNQFHEIAMREARIATEALGADPTPVDRIVAESKPGFVRRLRLAFAGHPPTTTDVCTCPA